MRLPLLATSALAAAAIALIAGCSSGNGAGSVMAPVAGAPNAAAQQPNAKIPFAYISDSITDSVNVFGSDGSFQRRIVTGIKTPGGMFVDSDHNLWVANAGHDNVLEFARGASKPMRTLEVPIAGGEPIDVTICPRGGTYVATSSSGTIEVFGAGSTKPNRSFTYPQLSSVSAITCDAKGNIFASGVVYFRGATIEFPHGRRAGAKILPVPGGTYGMRMDAAGNLLIADQSAATITEYTEAGVATGLSIKTTAGAQCISFGVTTAGVIGCPIYTEGSTATTVGASYKFPHNKTETTFIATLVGQPFGFAFDSP